jgi:hypothetical protein
MGQMLTDQISAGSVSQRPAWFFLRRTYQKAPPLRAVTTSQWRAVTCKAEYSVPWQPSEVAAQHAAESRAGQGPPCRTRAAEQKAECSKRNAATSRAGGETETAGQSRAGTAGGAGQQVGTRGGRAGRSGGVRARWPKVRARKEQVGSGQGNKPAPCCWTVGTRTAL